MYVVGIIYILSNVYMYIYVDQLTDTIYQSNRQESLLDNP